MAGAPAYPVTLPPGAVDAQTHMYLPAFPPPPGAPNAPADPLPTPGAYRAVMDRLGVERVVVTQGNAHGTDNESLLACLAAMGDCARGVAVITPETPDAELERLHGAGVRGARIMDLPGGAVGLDRLAEVDARAAAMGWVLAVQFDGSTILDRLALLGRLESRWILEHHGKFFAGAAPGGLEETAVLSLIDRGNCWFKFAAPYESSREGPPYADVGALARSIAAYAPERLLWGSNWPHNLAARTGQAPDDAELLALACAWAGSDRARRLMLAENPARLFGFPAPPG
ncbi:amidohydrolase family protein [Rhodovulum sp. DZ06]|uniref:amidohydrolase family protein n=1 Tax=Rhodovulum sp. DZ06 TaxID=3425126 RepID=UPI003D33FB32